jgi:hypothetical protein
VGRRRGLEPGPRGRGRVLADGPRGVRGYFGDGKLIGGGSIVSYDGRHGFLGRYIVCPDLRGRGIGRGLWADLCETLGARLEPGALDRDRRRLRDAGLLRHDRVPLLAPEANAGAVALADRHGMHEVFGCARMYMGEAPPIPWERVYGVTTFELG